MTRIDWEKLKKYAFAEIKAKKVDSFFSSPEEAERYAKAAEKADKRIRENELNNAAEAAKARDFFTK